jgi:hypothetical protein
MEIPVKTILKHFTIFLTNLGFWYYIHRYVFVPQETWNRGLNAIPRKIKGNVVFAAIVSYGIVLLFLNFDVYFVWE